MDDATGGGGGASRSGVGEGLSEGLALGSLPNSTSGPRLALSLGSHTPTEH